jgi:ABC-type glycerol-3-phosphate transport system permease component
MGIQWSLMAATSVLALIPAAVAVAFTQRYIVQGLRI